MMKKLNLLKLNFFMRRICRDQRGSVALVVAISVSAVVGLGGLITQEAILFRTQRALQASTNLAALAGAQDINCCTATPGKAVTTAASYSALNPVSGQTVSMVSGYPQLKCLDYLKNAGVSCVGPDNKNAIVVQQQVTVPLLFGGLFGKATKVITATATAGSGGGGGTGGSTGTGKALDVMLVLDTTASMNNADTSCSISGATRVICAAAGARELLKKFQPSMVNVGLMVFPGVTTAAQAAKDYDCSSSTQPTIAAYKSSPLYQIIGLSNDYRTSDTAATLNTSSNLVKAVKGGASGCTAGLSSVGGVGTYFADVMATAQNTLTTSGRAGVEKVIILLSDGDAGASSSNMVSSKVANQCHQAITAAAAATAAGTKVYTVAYGATTSSTSSCSTDSPKISACSTLQQMASTPAQFYSDTLGGSSACTSSANPVSALGNDLIQIYKSIANSLTMPPRLLPNGTT